MGRGISFARTPATIDEIDARVRLALFRHPLCRRLDFDILPTLLNGYGANWTVKFRSAGGACPDEAASIIHDIQEAYQLSEVDAAQGIFDKSPQWTRRSQIGAQVGAKVGASLRSQASREPATVRTMVRP